MEISLTLTQQDWLRYQLYLEKNLPSRTLSRLLGGGYVVLGALAVLLALWLDSICLVNIAFVLGFLLAFLALWALGISQARKAYFPIPGGAFCSQHRFVFDQQGIHTESDGSSSYTSWRKINRVEHTDEMIMLFLDTAYAFILPCNQLQDPNALLRLIENYWTQADSDKEQADHGRE